MQEKKAFEVEYRCENCGKERRNPLEQKLEKYTDEDIKRHFEVE